MINKIELENKRTFVIGDIHGDLDMLKTHITNDEDIRNCNLIIAGDIGLGFKKTKTHFEEYHLLNKWLNEKGINLYLIRGNHDKPEYFNSQLIELSNVIAIEDYTILTINNTNILCVGGAISIDRTYRLRKYSERLLYFQKIYEGTLTDEDLASMINKGYWENEMPIYNEDILNEIKENNIQLSYIITHTSPSFAFKTGTKGIEYWFTVDKDLNEDLIKERQVLTDIYNKVVLEDEHPIKEWIYGHFHEHHEDDFNNIHFTALLNVDYKWEKKELEIN